MIHLTKQILVNDIYINIINELCIKCSDGGNNGDKASINAKNDRGNRQQQWPYDRNRGQSSYDMGRTSSFNQDRSLRKNTKYNKTPFKGICIGCGKEYYHAGECYFLLKVKHVIAYLKSNLKADMENSANTVGNPPQIKETAVQRSRTYVQDDVFNLTRILIQMHFLTTLMTICSTKPKI